MIKSEYAKAYTEVLEIIRHFPKEEFFKIPAEEIEFFQNNMDKDYVFTIDPEIDLSEQNISPEANAIIVNLFRDYFATEEQKVKIKEILDLNQKKEEQEKVDSEAIFKKSDKGEKVNTEMQEKNKELIEYKESFFTKFKNFIFKILHIRN